MSTRRINVPVGPGLAPDQFALDVSGLRGFLWEYAIGLVRNHAEADDLVHDTMVRALSCRHRFRSGSNLRAWTRSIMRNIFIDGWRRQPAYVDLDLERISDSNPPAPEAELGPLDLVRMDDLRLAAAQLRTREREMFTLAHVEGVSYREIGTQLQLSVQTVGSQLFRIRQKIRSILEVALAAHVRSQAPVALGSLSRLAATPAARSTRTPGRARRREVARDRRTARAA